MEYKSIYMALFGLIALILWTVDFWKLFKKGQLRLPLNTKSGNVKIKRTFIFLIGCIGWILISIALSGPRKPLKTIQGDIDVNDIFFVVDVSRSMLADDLKPNRLEVAKVKLREFAKLRLTDRLGIIIFSEKVFTMLPLTTDTTLVDKVLSEVKIGYLGSGTNIGDALALAVARGEGSEAKSKVIILLTDGVNNVGNMTPIKAANLAKEYGMKVYTIGLGTVKNARLPIGKDLFGKTQYQQIPGGSIDLKTLNEISTLTGGKSYMADSENSLEEILGEIQKLEKTKIQTQNQVVYDEQYFIFLFWGMIFFLASKFLRRFVLKEVA